MVVAFTQHLSTMYRYILQTWEREVVPLAEEIKMADAFIFLLKARFGDNLIVEIKLSAQDTTHFVAPLTIQMLIENAVKHNIISADKPLFISIFSQQGHWLVVENTLQKKLTPSAESTHTGLANIINRYQLLSPYAAEICSSETHFTVKLPLLTVSQTQKPYTIKNP